MKILMWITLYFIISVIITFVISIICRHIRGYSIRSFYDLKPDEQRTMFATILFWPVVVIIIAIYIILDGITKITNRKDGSE